MAAKAHGWRTVLVGTTDRDSGLPLQVSKLASMQVSKWYLFC